MPMQGALPKVPKIQVDSLGRRYIRSNKQKIFLADNITERQLLHFIVGRLTRTKQRRTARNGSKGVPADVTPPSASTAFRSYPTHNVDPRQLETDLKSEKVKNEILNVSKALLASSTSPALSLPASPALSLPASPALALLAGLPAGSSRADLDKLFLAQYGLTIAQAEAMMKESQAQTQSAQKAKQEALDKLAQANQQSEMKRLRQEYTTKISRDALEKLAVKHKIVLKKLGNSIKTKIDLVDELEALGALNFNPQSSASSSSSSSAPLALRQSSLSGTGIQYNKKKGLSTSQINAIMSKFPQFLGTYASDQLNLLPIKPKTEFGFILNKDKISQEGSHWVAVYSDGKSSIEFYDSFANPPTPTFMKDLKGIAQKLKAESYLKLKINKVIQQDEGTTNCGFFACKFLIDRFRGKPFSEASKYDDSLKGEKNIEAFKSKLSPFGYINGFSSDPQCGEGIWDGIKTIGKTIGRFSGQSLKKIFDVATTNNPRLDFSPSIRKLFEKSGDQRIESIRVTRKPILNFISKFLNVVTLGQFEKNLAEAGYDKAMHLYLLIKLVPVKDGDFIIKAEKNHVIEISGSSEWEPSGNAESIVIPFNKSITLKEFFERGRQSVSAEKYFVYDSRSQNCQIWLRDNLKANGLWTDQIANFVLQDANAIYKNLGLLEKFNKSITNVAANIDHAVFGAGEKGKKISLRC